jgi:hypothetical protein
MRTWSNNAGRNPWLKWYITIFALIWAVIEIPQSAKELTLGFESEHWPQVESTVATADWSTGRHGDEVVPHITYQYQVNGQAYHSDRYAFDSGSAYDRGDVTQSLREYVPGATVKSYYNPNDPEVSVLVPGAMNGPTVGIGISIVFLICAIWQFRPQKVQ